MTWGALFDWLHLLSVALLGGLWLVQSWLCARPLDRVQLRLLGQASLAALLALAGVVATGLPQLTLLGAGPDLRFADPLFVVKLALAGLLAAAALWTAARILHWTREARQLPVFAPRESDWLRLRAVLAAMLGGLAVAGLVAVLAAT